MTDIVARLREFIRMGIAVGPFHAELAADEIERLRADVKRWSNWAIDYACDDETCECDRCVNVRAAWNGLIGCVCHETVFCPEHYDPTKD